MNGLSKAAACRMRMAALAVALGAATTAGATALPQSWNGWHWAHTGNLDIMLGDNVGSAWDSYLRRSAALWSKDKYIDFSVTGGRTSASGCAPVYGTVQACSADYGATGWLGYATVWTSGNYIVQATVKLNDFYFSQSRFNTVYYRDQVSCQEVGHTIGLAHIDVNYSNTNLGTCMDYTNDPSGKKGSNGTKANISPSGTDFKNLDRIYATFDSTQLPYTKPGFLTGEPLGLPGSVESEAVSVALPEPSSWMVMILGFGALGLSLRRDGKARARA